MSAAAKHTAVAAVSVALVAALSLAGAASGATAVGRRDHKAPSAPTNIQVTAAMPSAVSLAWNPSTDNVGVAGYGVYSNGVRVQTQGQPSTTYPGLACGTAYALAVDAYDAAGNRSKKAAATVSTATCPDSQAPTTPTGFRQQATTQDAVVLAWDASTDNIGVVGYGVYRDGLLNKSTPDPTVTLTGLVCGSVYEIPVDAVDAAGNRSQPGSAWVQTAPCSDVQAPSTPTGLAVTARTETSMQLAWSPATDDVGVVGYHVSVNGTPVLTVSQPVATLSNLSCARLYTIAVDAYDAAGNRSSAVTLSAATSACAAPLPPPGDSTAPSQPTGLAVTAATSTSISLSWAASTDNVGVAGYAVYVDGTSVQTQSQPGATVSGLACGTAYTLAVDAYDAASNRSTKSSLIATTAACADAQAPAAPANVLTTSRTATSIALSWSAASDNVGVVGYGLYRGGTLVGTTAVTTGIFSGLTCGTLYTLAVDAYDAAGNRSQRTTLTVATTACPDTTPPSTPTGLAASSVTQTSLTLTWNGSSDAVGVTGYDVYRNGTKLGSITSTSSNQSGLSCGTSYSFAVAAYDAAGNHSPQAQLSATTAACSPPPPPPPAAAAGTVIDSFDDTTTPWGKNLINRWQVPLGSDPWSAPGDSGTPWPSGGGIWQASTPYGPGFRMIATDEMQVTSGGKKSEMADIGHLIPNAPEEVEVWSAKVMFPAAGNPNGFPRNYPDWGVFFQFHDSVGAGGVLGMGIDTTDAPFRNNIYLNSYVNGVRHKAEDPNPVVYDHWYDWKLEIRWSSTTAGYIKWWLDGTLLTGSEFVNIPTRASGDNPYMQVGFYSAAQLRNEVLHAALRKS